jgi:hypothetical protein
MSIFDIFWWNFHSLCCFWWRKIKNKNKKFWVIGDPDGYLWPLGPVGELLVQKYAMLYQSYIFFEKLLYGSIRKKNKMGVLRKKIFEFFLLGSPLIKKLTKIFFIQILQFIHQSKALVELTLLRGKNFENEEVLEI